MKKQDFRPRLLVLIDFSSYTMHLMKMADAWSRWLDAELVLIHQPVIAVPLMADYASKEQIHQQELDEAYNKLKTIANEYVSDPDKVSFMASPAPLSVSLERFLKEPYYNILFAGLKGKGLLKRIFIGSTVTSLVDELDNVLIAVPKNPVNVIPGKLYISVSYQYPINTDELDNFIRHLGAELKSLQFISVAEDEGQVKLSVEYLKKLEEKYKRDFQVSVLVKEAPDALHEIKHYMQKQTDGMLIVQRGTREFKDIFFRKFLINELVYDASIPLVVLP